MILGRGRGGLRGEGSSGLEEGEGHLGPLVLGPVEEQVDGLEEVEHEGLGQDVERVPVHEDEVGKPGLDEEAANRAGRRSGAWNAGAYRLGEA